MVKSLCIGVLESDPAWETILTQIGCDFEAVSFAKDLSASYSCIILNSLTNDAQLDQIQYYIEMGGIVIDELGLNLYPHKEISKVYHQFIRNEHEMFTEPFIDFYESLSRLKSAKYWDHTLSIEEMDRGYRVFLGWPLKQLFKHSGFIRKKFNDEDHLYPNEIVSKTSWGALRRTIQDLLIHLHELVALPFVSKLNSPGQSSSFLFRIDTDYSNQQTISKLYELAQKHQMKLTWFLHVEAHRDWLGVFKEMQGQEIALHGYEHATSASHAKNKQNIRSASKELMEAEIPFEGFCAPYGIWSQGLGKAIDEEGITYSSEFTLNYDDLPFHALNEGKVFNHLQIPIHPICIGSFQRKRASQEQMKAYFDEVILEKIKLGEAIVLYHHPMQNEWEVLDFIFKRINELGIQSLTFGEYTRFWKSRNAKKLNASFTGTSIQFDSDIKQVSVYFDKNRYTMPVNNSSVSIDDLNGVIDREFKQMDKKAFRKLKTATLRDIKLSFQDRMRRKKL